MPLIKSISGIRGTIGERKGEDLTKEDIVLYTRSFVVWLKSERSQGEHFGSVSPITQLFESVEHNRSHERVNDRRFRYIAWLNGFSCLHQPQGGMRDL